MDTILLTVTALSLGLALGMAVFAAALVGDNRRRSRARVAVLTEMAGLSDGHEPAVVQTADESAPQAGPAAFDDLPLLPADGPVAGVSELFAQTGTAASPVRPLAFMGAFAAITIACGLIVWSSAGGPPVAAPSANRAPAPDGQRAPIELMTLRYAQHDSSLTVTGLVRNPRGSAPIAHVVATVVVYGEGGGVLSNGRAALDFVTLGPGDQSPFVVTVPVTAPVARYRVGFRTEDGRVIVHVDKRGPDALARK